MDFNNISLSYIMDWVVFASCIVLIITVVFDIVKSVKDKSGLSDEHKFLNKEHSRIESLIREEAYKAEHTIEKDNSQIIGIVTNIDKTIFAEKEIRNERYNNLNAEQKDIKKHIEAVSQLMKELERLQTLSIEQQNEISKLVQENKILREQLTCPHQTILPGQIPPTQDFGGFTQHR